LTQSACKFFYEQIFEIDVLNKKIFITEVPMDTTILSQFADFFKQIPDPRSEQGISRIFALVLLGLLAQHAYIAHIVQ
jgi:hypothetical protein